MHHEYVCTCDVISNDHFRHIGRTKCILKTGTKKRNNELFVYDLLKKELFIFRKKIENITKAVITVLRIDCQISRIEQFLLSSLAIDTSIYISTM